MTQIVVSFTSSSTELVVVSLRLYELEKGGSAILFYQIEGSIFDFANLVKQIKSIFTLDE